MADKPKSNFGYLGTCLKSYKWRLVGTLTALALARLASTADPLYLKKIIDQIVNGAGVGKTSVIAVLTPVILIYFGLKVTTFIGEFIRDWVFAPVEMGVGRKVSESVFDYLLKLPVSYHAEQKTGALARKIARGSRAITFILD
nr:ABC transporter transmembrane domain-containing protein [Armatimonadota bacterium]